MAIRPASMEPSHVPMDARHVPGDDGSGYEQAQSQFGRAGARRSRLRSAHRPPRDAVPQYTELLEDSRRHAMDRMIENARLLGANAVVSMRFDSSEMGQQLTEIVAYGTAVVAVPAE
jgi:hypothetical protein